MEPDSREKICSKKIKHPFIDFVRKEETEKECKFTCEKVYIKPKWVNEVKCKKTYMKSCTHTVERKCENVKYSTCEKYPHEECKDVYTIEKEKYIKTIWESRPTTKCTKNTWEERADGSVYWKPIECLKFDQMIPVNVTKERNTVITKRNCTTIYKTRNGTYTQEICWQEPKINCEKDVEIQMCMNVLKETKLHDLDSKKAVHHCIDRHYQIEVPKVAYRTISQCGEDYEEIMLKMHDLQG